MRVLHLATDVYGGHGGIALYNRDFVAALAKHPCIEEIVVLPRLIHSEPEPFPPKVRFLAGAAHSKIAYGAMLTKMLVRERPFDLVVCAHVNLLPYTVFTRRAPLLMVYGIEAWQPHWMPPRLRAVAAISELTLERFRSWAHPEAPAFLLPNAIDLSLYGIRPKSDALLDRYGLRGRRVLLTVGRVVAEERYKGFDEVIEVLRELPEDIAYLIAGGGSDIDRLRAKALSCGVADRVVFTGLFDECDKPALYNLADVYVMPSRGEGFGFVLLEALASGVPVIGSRHDGGREALRNGDLGILVDPASGAELRAAILELLARNERHIPDGLAYFAVDQFDTRVHAMVDALEPR
ncbi:MAG TPA: glycosyltransferase family 4 protein [Thermoanaerobaculia bacterium]|nr:glycosyltransferase family 4 protein [Thermoanaerobaculia bacterium]